jgi:peptide/nickel transport system permease protein
MATGTDSPDTFEDVDWDEIDRQRGQFNLSKAAIAEVLTYLAILAGFVWDYQILSSQTPTLDFIPAIRYGDVMDPQDVLFQVANFQFGVATWDFTSTDWLFILTLAVMLFQVGVPAYRNKRLTIYYWQEFKKNKLAVASLIFLIGFFLLGTLGPVLMAPPTLTFADQYQPPVGITASPTGQEVTGTWAHPLGTDHQGQDMLKLVVYGMRVSLQVGLIATLVAVIIGTVVGATAAHVGGMVDEVLMRYVDIQSVFPAFILLLLFIYAYGAWLWMIIALFGFFSWEGVARLIRGEALQRTEEQYVQASESAGASQAWIVRRHIIPNVSKTMITAASLSIPAFVLGEASLAYLGLSDDSVYSWGKVIAGGRGDLANAPWISLIPGLFLFGFVLAFNYVGDAMSDAMDPREEA